MYINNNGEPYNGHSIIFNDRLIINPSDDMLINAGYHKLPERELTEEELLEDAIAHKIMEIDNYDNSDEVNAFFIDGKSMWLDAKTRQTLKVSIDSYKALGYEKMTKWFNGMTFTFSLAYWEYMLNLLEVYASESLNTTEAHIAQVSSMTDIDDIKNFDVTKDYPQKLNLTTDQSNLIDG